MTDAHILITHYVGGDVATVFAGFTEDLFLRLAPKLPPNRLVRYDGNRVGDFVIIELGVPPVSQDWVSEIISHDVGERESSFTDEGRQLPFPLQRWRHVHRVRQEGPDRVAIIEDISYSGGSAFVNALLRPFLTAQFEARGSAYRAAFGTPAASSAAHRSA